MAEECCYYYYESGYCCALKRQKEGYSSIDSDTVHRYCWGYHYEECPRYKERNGSGGCYLTSACVEVKGLADNCHQLQTLRRFRDGYLRSIPGGTEEIEEYYIIAPKIVTNIKKEPNCIAIFEKIYSELVAPCVDFIENKDYEQAHILYRNYTIHLKKLYL